jgi:hypothetical protein
VKVLDYTAPVRCALLAQDRETLTRVACELSVTPHGTETHAAVTHLEHILRDSSGDNLLQAREALQHARVFHAQRSTLDYWLESMPALAEDLYGTVDEMVSENAAAASMLHTAIAIVDGYLAGFGDSLTS